MGNRRKLGITVAALVAVVYFLNHDRKQSESSKKFETKLRSVWATCKAIYPQAKGSDFENCISLSMTADVFLPEKN
jgi:hypothetical protein